MGSLSVRCQRGNLCICVMCEHIRWPMLRILTWCRRSQQAANEVRASQLAHKN